MHPRDSTIELVYVLGIASKNHSPRPRRKPRPSALTYTLTLAHLHIKVREWLRTRALTILPSSLAMPILRTVRRTRNVLWTTTMPTSGERYDGNVIRRIARSWRRKERSTLGLLCAEVERRGKWGLWDKKRKSGVGRIGTWRDIRSVNG